MFELRPDKQDERGLTAPKKRRAGRVSERIASLAAEGVARLIHAVCGVFLAVWIWFVVYDPDTWWALGLADWDYETDVSIFQWGLAVSAATGAAIGLLLGPRAGNLLRRLFAAHQ